MLQKLHIYTSALNLDRLNYNLHEIHETEVPEYLNSAWPWTLMSTDDRFRSSFKGNFLSNDSFHFKFNIFTVDLLTFHYRQRFL